MNIFILKKICINHVLIKKRQYQKAHFYNELEENSSLLADDTPFWDDHIDKEYFLQLFEKLPDKYREVFNLFVIDGYSHKEISETLGISQGNSRIIVNRARKFLQEKIDRTLII